jgi:hypothetical protein
VTALAPTLQAFFTERLITQRHVSAHTVTAYRDTWRLLLGFAAEHTGSPVSTLDLAQLDAPLIGAFCDHLEHDRGNSVRTRNARLAAIHSLFRFAALRHPEHAASIAGCWLSRPSASTGRWSPTSPTPRPTRCWPPPTGTAGPDDAITPCCCWTSRPGCASPN